MRRRTRGRELCTTDCETDPFKNGRVPRPFIWGFYYVDCEEYLEFETGQQLAEHVRDKKLLVYAHNGGKFDFHYLRDEANADQPVMLINGRIAKFNIGECEFRDSLCIFPNTRLKDIGEKEEIDYALMEPGVRDDPNNRAVISRYLRQDCVTLGVQVARYHQEYGRSLTQATASMKFWQKQSGREPPRQTKAQHDRYKPFYYGGRVQCFEQGNGITDFSVADINSAYPKAMESEHVISEQAVVERHLPKDRDIYKCLIELDCTSRGAFPWRDPETNELYFPDDEAGERRRMRRYFVTGWEFMAGLEHDALANIHIRRVHRFTRVCDFKEYIQHHYAVRMEAAARGDKVGKNFGKYFMNSLYGKFGANCENYAEYVIATSDTYPEWTQPSRRNGGLPYSGFKAWGSRYLLQRKPSEDDLNDLSSRWRYYNVATAASITGYVRAYLFRNLQRASGLLYCDTDSIAARDTSRLDFGQDLGKWKNEGAFDRYAIAGKKLYAFHRRGASEIYDPTEEVSPTWKIASKGVNFAAMVNGPELIQQLAAGGEIVHAPDVPTYSVIRNEPMFIPRTLRKTAKDIRHAPDQLNVPCQDLVTVTIRF